MAATDFFEFDLDSEIQHLCQDSYDNYFTSSHQYEHNVGNQVSLLPDSDEQTNEALQHFDFLQDQDKQLVMCLEIENDHKNQETIVVEHNEEEQYWRDDCKYNENVEIQREITVLPQNHGSEQDFLDPEAFLEFVQPTPSSCINFQDNLSPQIKYEAPIKLELPIKLEVQSPMISMTDISSTPEDEFNSLDDLKSGGDPKKGSAKQDGTLAFLRQCIFEIKAGMDIIFSPQEEILKLALWNYINKVSKKAEIQKQPKKKIKYLLIPCLDKGNTFNGLDVEASNVIRKKCYAYIRHKIETQQFENNFLKLRNYGKADKNGKERSRFDAESKILPTLHQYFEEIKKPSKFRGLFSDVLYTADIEWIKKIESKERRVQDDDCSFRATVVSPKTFTLKKMKM